LAVWKSGRNLPEYSENFSKCLFFGSYPANLAEAVLYVKNLPNCTSETIKARPFQRIQKLFLPTKNDLAFILSVVQFGNSALV
jgi:hypothetical protein